MRDKIIKDTVLYSSTTFLARVLGFLRSIVVARFLGPSLYGLWTALSIILEYSRYSSAGILNAMNREIPFYRGKKDHVKVERIRNIGFTMACVPSFIVGLTLVLISIFIKNRVGIEYVIALRAIAILVFMRQLYDFFTLLFRSAHEFMFLGKLQIFFAIIDLTLVTILIITFGFYGFLWAMAMTYTAIIGYIFYRIRHAYRLRFYMNKALLMNLARIGILITLIGLAVNLRVTIDRLMILKFLGVTQLGYFGMSLVLIQFIFLIPSSIAQILYPRLVERYGASNKDTGVLRNYVEVSTQTLAYSMPLLIGEVFLILPFGIRMVLPQYIPGTVAAQITILGLFFFSVGIIATNFLITTNRLYLYLGYAACAVIINFILDFAFLRAGFGIKGVALGGIVITSFIYASFVLGSVMFHYLESRLKTILYLLKMYFPFIYCIIILAILHYFDLHIIVRMIIFAVSCLPLFWKLEKDTRAISLVVNVIKGKA